MFTGLPHSQDPSGPQRGLSPTALGTYTSHFLVNLTLGVNTLVSASSFSLQVSVIVLPKYFPEMKAFPVLNPGCYTTRESPPNWADASLHGNMVLIFSWEPANLLCFLVNSYSDFPLKTPPKLDSLTYLIKLERLPNLYTDLLSHPFPFLKKLFFN